MLQKSIFHDEIMVSAFLAHNGGLGTSRLLFISWDFIGDFHKGFQVACKLVGLLKSLRTATGYSQSS